MFDLSKMDLGYVRQKLSIVYDPVQILFFKSKKDGDKYQQLEQLEGAIGLVNPNLSFSMLDVEGNTELVKKYKIDKTPAIVLEGKQKGLIRYFGFPRDNEFGVFLQDIIDASTGSPELNPEVEQGISKIDFPLHLEIFVTSTCPYCPQMSKAVHDFGLLNKNVIADIIDSNEFPGLSRKYKIASVPKTIINGKTALEGVYSQDILLRKVFESKR